MSAWAKPGVKCVCINASWWAGSFVCPIAEGETYTIADVVPLDSDDWAEIPIEGAVGVRLVEAWNGDHSKGIFASVRFQPLVARTQEQDLEHVLSLLNTEEMV